MYIGGDWHMRDTVGSRENSQLHLSGCVAVWNTRDIVFHD